MATFLSHTPRCHFTITLIIYFSYPSGYKHYCQNGNMFRPAMPDKCPYCGCRGCLIRHGRYERIELMFGYHRRYGPFYIYRLLCKHSHRTISMHPDFCVSYKRYPLCFVIPLLYRNIVCAESLRQLSKQHKVCVRTIKRWRHGLGSQELSKRLCLFARSTGPPGPDFTQQLLTFFITAGNGNAVFGAALAQLRLQNRFCISLY